MKNNSSPGAEPKPINQSINQPLSYVDVLKILTPREVEVLELIAKGYTDLEIAGALFIAVRTVHSHKRKMYKKIGLSGNKAIPKWLWNSKNGDLSGDRWTGG